MPHHMIDEIQSRKGEKVALFLTFENAAGLILGVLPAFMLSGALPWWLRILIVVAAGAVGVLATLEVGGLAFYERMIWAARGWLAQRTSGDRITPEQLVGAPSLGRRNRALPIDGPVRAVPIQRGVPGVVARAQLSRQRPGRSAGLLIAGSGGQTVDPHSVPYDEDEPQIAIGTDWVPIGAVRQPEDRNADSDGSDVGN